MFDLMKQEHLNDLHFCQDSKTGLQAIIAIHNTLRGPALGGCRFLSYYDTESAARDAARLARGMSYKAALADIPHGGGKTVVIKPEGKFDRTALMKSLGDFIDTLHGRYITAVDSGTTSEDMDIIATRTRYTTSTSSEGNPSAYTAQGVLAGIKAAVNFRLGRKTLEGTHVALQGLGHVGLALAQQLEQEGVKLTVTDANKERIQECCELIQATPVPPEEIHRIQCDVFTPCALGGIINERTLPEFRCSIIAGSANNQLAEESMGQALLDRDILYAPDYAINAGGLIYAALHYHRASSESINKKISAITTTLGDIFQQAAHAQSPTNQIANRLAEAKLYLRPAHAKTMKDSAAEIHIDKSQGLDSLSTRSNSLH